MKPQLHYNRVPLNKLMEHQKDQTIDIVAVVHHCNDVSEITSKATQKTITKRELEIVDDSNMMVRLTLWGRQAEQFNHADNPVLAIKGVKVGEYGGRSLSVPNSASMQINPDMKDAHAVKGWYNNAVNSGQTNFEMYTAEGRGDMGGEPGKSGKKDSLKLIQQVRDENLGGGDKVDYFPLSNNR